MYLDFIPGSGLACMHSLLHQYLYKRLIQSCTTGGGVSVLVGGARIDVLAQSTS